VQVEDDLNVRTILLISAKWFMLVLGEKWPDGAKWQDRV
jgi:hypothetical protein